MIKVRSNVFETNSSSTHSITICTEDQYTRFVRNELLFDSWKEEFVEDVDPTESEISDAEVEYKNNMTPYMKNWNDLSDEDKKHYAKSHIVRKKFTDLNRYVNYSEYMEMSELESFLERFTTPSGDKMVAFGRYGYDG